jgi:hypothetical protein
MELEILARGQVGDTRRKLFRDVGKPAELTAVEDAAGDLDAHHLHPRLSLAVDAVAEAEGAEALRGKLALEKAMDLGFYVVDFLRGISRNEGDGREAWFWDVHGRYLIHSRGWHTSPSGSGRPRGG